MVISVQSNGASLSMDKSVLIRADLGSGVFALDARQSESKGQKSGATQGLHKYNITRLIDTVDLLGTRTAASLVAGGNVNLSGGEAEKSNGGNSWNSSASSSDSRNPLDEDFAVSWLVESITGTIREMGGLDDNPTFNNSYNSIEFAIYQVDRLFYSRVYESGAAIPIPGYNNTYLNVGDRLGVRCENGVVTYFILRGDAVIDVYTSAKRATVPLFYKAAFNRGQGQSGHSRVEGVEWHLGKKSTSKTVSISGHAQNSLSDDDKDALLSVGLVAQDGAKYSHIPYTYSPASRFSNGQPVQLTHSYIGTEAQSTLEVIV